MYGFFTRNMTWTKAFRTTTQRATCSATPRQLRRRFFGNCHLRLQSQIAEATPVTGKLCAKNSTKPTREMRASATKETRGAQNSTRVVMDDRVYQVCANRNCSAWRGE